MTTTPTTVPASLHLTRLVLNPRHPAVRRDLREVTDLHRTLMSLLPDNLPTPDRPAARALHRTDTQGPHTMVLLQTDLPPDPDRLPAGYLAKPAETKDIAPALTALSRGLTIAYRALINPTRAALQPRAADGTSVRGRRTAVPTTDLPDWWQRKALIAGLQLNELSTTYSTHPTIKARRTGRPPAIHAAVRIDGTATITDADALRAAVRSGIGHGKAHGLGMLSLAPARS